MLVGCATDAGEKQVGGVLLGAVVGGLLGAQIGGGRGQLAAAAAGTLLGAYLGSEVGKSLDRADRQHAERTARNGLQSSPSGHTTRWVNPDSGHFGTFTPANAYRSRDGLNCRDYQQSVSVDGRTRTVIGTACRMDDGSWRVANRR
jgi:surface antigen